MPARMLIIASAVAVAAACGGRSSAWKTVPVSEVTPQERDSLILTGAGTGAQPDPDRCQIRVLRNEGPPPVGEVVDSAALHRAIAELAAGSEERGYAVYTVAWDSLDAPEEVAHIAGTLSETPSAEIGEVLRAHQRTRPTSADTVLSPDADAGFHFLQRPEPSDTVRIRRVRFRVDLVDDPRFRVGWTTECPPVMKNGEAVSRKLQELVDQAPVGVFTEFDEEGNRVPARRRVVVWVFVDESGLPTRTQLKKVSSHLIADRIAVQVTKFMRFSPAAWDGQPLGVWVAIPITMK